MGQHGGKLMAETAGFIMARGGSKTIPRKNLYPLAGAPMLEYTCRAALASRRLGRVFLSTDSPEIAETGKRCGVEAPFIRPVELAQDDSPGIEALRHAIRWVDEHLACRPDYVLELQPTSPLRTAGDIDDAITLMEEKQADSVVSVTPAAEHPYLMKTIDAEGRLTHFIETEFATRRRQELPPVFALHGSIKIARREVLLDRGWYTERTYALVTPPERSVDIDTRWDLKVAELVLRDRNPD